MLVNAKNVHFHKNLDMFIFVQYIQRKMNMLCPKSVSKCAAVTSLHGGASCMTSYYWIVYVTAGGYVIRCTEQSSAPILVAECLQCVQLPRDAPSSANQNCQSVARIQIPSLISFFSSFLPSQRYLPLSSTIF